MPSCTPQMTSTLVFCQEIESSQQLRDQYCRRVRNIAKWYKATFERYNTILKTEIGMEALAKELEEINYDPAVISDMAQDFLDDLDYANGAKMSYFSMSDALVKLMLSKFSIGPGPNNQFLTECGISADLRFKSGSPRSWISCSADVYELAEVLAKVLRDKVGTFSVDFLALCSDREARGKLTHSGEASLCLSAMRCYNVIRDMLVFMDSDYRDQLPFFEFEELFDYDRMLAEPCCFSFDNATTILIADSVHDVRRDYRKAIANMPWNLVIDLDGYSDCGGLLETVEHNRIQREVLCRNVADNLTQLPVDHTLWYRCGEYQSIDFLPQKSLSIGAYTEFHKNLPYSGKYVRMADKLNNLCEILTDLLLCAKNCDRIINIVILTDNTNIVKYLIRAAESSHVRLEDYFITWVGLASTEEVRNVRAEYSGDREWMQTHFLHHSCLTYQFYQAFSEHGSYWQTRQSLKSDFSLPSVNGPVTLSENERNNIANDFLALYDHCEEETAERSEELRLLFYSGNTASWNTIANEYIPRLRKSSEFEQMKQTIKTLLGQTQQNPQKRLFFINHTAGIGGSTIARQLVWDLHMDYAVLEVRNYVPQTFKSRIEHLYDSVLDKSPIILFADDTLPYFKNLCEEVCRLDRRCVLVSACRNDSGILRDYPNANYKSVSSIQDSTIPILRERYRQVSPLSEVDLRQKDTYFADMVQGSMLTPFIIGLYYKEQDFSIESYVTKALNGCYERRYADVLAYLAMCDRYKCKNLPVSFVRQILGLSMREDFLRLVPAASSVVTVERQSSGIEYYHFMHPLLSDCFLDKYCEKYYGGKENLRNAVYELSFQLIDHMAETSKTLPENAPHLDILISIMIQNKRGDSDVQSQYLSALMMDIGMPESQRQLMNHLATKFQPLADGILSAHSRNPDEYFKRNEQQILRLVSHSYAHLGRMYSRDAHNHAEAYESFKKAIEYMPDDDPNVFHMAGSALLDKLKQKFDDSNAEFDQKALSDIHEDVQCAGEYFDNTICYGSPEYGYPSKLELLYRTLQFLFRINNIQSEADLPKLDPTSRLLQSKFMDTLEEAKNYYDFDDIAQGKISEYENRFRSKIVFGNYSQAVEYYQNKVDVLRSSPDIVGYGNSLRSLIYAQINQARYKNPEVPFYHNLKNARKMLTDIESLLLQPFDPERFSDYTLRTQMFHYWMLLAKYLELPVDQGLVMAKRWMAMEEDRRNNLNPEPYYYHNVLLRLSIKSGNAASVDELRELTHLIGGYDIDGVFDRRRGSLTKIRDVFVSGKEMGQLFDVTHCKADEEIYESVVKQNRTPVPVSAHFEECPNPGLAYLRIYDPVLWSKEQVRMNIGRRSHSSLTSGQIGHRIMFVMGFGVCNLIALAHNSADIDAGEKMTILSVASEAHAAPKTSNTSPKKLMTSSDDKPTHNTTTVAILKNRQRTILRNIRLSKGDQWINGDVEGGIAGVSVKDDLLRFSKGEIAYYGGIEEVLKMLLKKAEVPCVILHVVESTPKPKYRASLFEACSTISELLGEAAKPQKKVPEPTPSSAETIAAVPNGKAVNVTLLSVQTDSATGTFQHEGTAFSITLKISNKKERESLQKAFRQKSLIKTRIIGFNKDNYLGKLINPK
ncbi:MAG: hypothetical protein ACI3W5_15580 [Faecousia sp.]